MKLKKEDKRKGGNMLCHLFEFATSQEAWEKINEYFLSKPKEVFDENSSYNSGISIVYNVFMKIRKAWVDPNFDYGKMFNYRSQKWTLLVNNYLDLNKLDLLSAVFSRKIGDDIPTITMVLRSSEITKRLIFDFLLVQRMGEYIYGQDQSFMLQLYVPLEGNLPVLYR